MASLKLLALHLAVALVAVPAAAQSVTADARATFVARQKQYHDSRIARSGNWKDVLYTITWTEGDPERVVARFARRIGASPEAAARYAFVIVDAAVEAETCRKKNDFSCRMTRALQHAASLGFADRTGNLLIAVGRSQLTREDSVTFLRLAQSHPAATAIFEALFQSDVNPAGEVPAFGFWFMRGAGGRWEAPIYLGLQQHFPYVVTRGSRLPSLRANGFASKYGCARSTRLPSRPHRSACV
jgi:hypothetical protein